MQIFVKTFDNKTLTLVVSFPVFPVPFTHRTISSHPR
jgi:hypothetical protein